MSIVANIFMLSLEDDYLVFSSKFKFIEAIITF